MSTDVDPVKEQFLKEFGDDYGYPNAEKNIDEMRNTEFKRLGDMVYLDHAGATLYSESQMEAVLNDFNSTVFANPHSQSDCSFNTSDRIGDTRRQVLNFFNASPQEYSCIFTSGATAALKLVGESFPWNNSCNFMYTMENHNSVLGIREFALSNGAAAVAVDIETSGNSLPFRIIQRSEQRRAESVSRRENPAGDVYNLFAFPSECNFSGLRLNLDLVKLFKEDSDRAFEGLPQYRTGSWMVLIDAAKGCATEGLDLSRFKADFVVVSFYKLFGYPTGLGALIIRNEAAKLLKKTYFGGGTVAASIADADFVKRRAGTEEYFEDGTIPYLGIASIVHGFKILNSLTMPAISRHTSSLATYVRKQLLAMRHENGNRVCIIYGLISKLPIVGMGPTITFNLLRPDSSWVGYRELEKLASLSGIQLRTGCFCNPGACAKFVGLSHSDLISNFQAGHVCWDDGDVLFGKPTGAVRASFGYMSTFEDANKFLKFIHVSFVSLTPISPNGHILRTTISPPENEGCGRICTKYSLKSISIYPIKSCMGFSVSSWPVVSTGLLHDREWILRGTSGEILTQKKVLDMFYIKTHINLKLGILEVESPLCEEKLVINLNSDLLLDGEEEMDIEGRRYGVYRYHNQVDIWFSNAVGRTCTLLRKSSIGSYSCINRNISPGMCRDVDTKLNFVNESQFLMVSEESIADLNHRLRSKKPKGLCTEAIQVSPLRFRPNLVVSGGEAYAEDGWRSMRIGDKHFTSLGGCNRCQMINLSVQAGKVQRFSEPLATLGTYRRVKGKITFGILLRYEVSVGMESDRWLHVGEEICATAD